MVAEVEAEPDLKQKNKCKMSIFYFSRQMEKLTVKFICGNFGDQNLGVDSCFGEGKKMKSFDFQFDFNKMLPVWGA